MPGVPNKRSGGICIGNKVAPIFFNTMEDAGALVFEAPVEKLGFGDVIEIRPYDGKILSESGEVLSEFGFKSDVILDEVQADGRINLIVGRGLTQRAREHMGLPPSEAFRQPEAPETSDNGYTLAQKMVGQACGVEGVRPGTYCEPKMTTVGSQDTTGPMTRDELKDLACLGFSADLVMQSFCHTAAYPKPVDIDTQHSLPDFIMNRGGVSLRPATASSTAGSTACCCQTPWARVAIPIPVSPWVFPSRAALAWWPLRRHRCDALDMPNRCWFALRAKCSRVLPYAIWFTRFPTTPSKKVC